MKFLWLFFCCSCVKTTTAKKLLFLLSDIDFFVIIWIVGREWIIVNLKNEFMWKCVKHKMGLKIENLMLFKCCGNLLFCWVDGAISENFMRYFKFTPLPFVHSYTEDLLDDFRNFFEINKIVQKILKYSENSRAFQPPPVTSIPLHLATSISIPLHYNCPIKLTKHHHKHSTMKWKR